MDAATRDELEGLVGEAAAGATATPLRHHAGNAVTAAIHRVEAGKESFVVKVVTGDGEGTWPTSDEPTHWNHWAREPLAYRDGLVTAYEPAAIRAPRRVAAVDRSPRTIALWLEDVTGVPGAAWEPRRFAVLAERLGRAQGAIAARGVPQRPWLSRRWLRGYLGRGAGIDEGVFERDALWASEPVRAAFSSAERDGLRRLWRDRDRFVRLVEAMPRTLAHLDCWSANLIDDRDETVLLDWSFLGEGALGEDPANLVPDAFLDFFLATDHLAEVEGDVYDAYVRGLREGGWTGESWRVRLAFTAASVKYCWVAPRMLALLESGPDAAVGYGGVPSRSVADALVERAPVLRMLLRWADEARTLAAGRGV